VNLPSKLHNHRQILAKIGGLVVAVALLGVLPATAQQIPAPTAAPATAPVTTTTPAKASTPPAASTDTSATDSSDTDFTNWVTLGAGDAWVSGDKGAYKHQQDTNSGPFGGVQDFHWQDFIGKSGTFTIDGHALAGNHDYDLKLDLTDEKLGYIRAGFTEFRTWYDSSGGYYPLNNLSFEPYANDLYVDRRSAWVEAGLTLPDLPSFVFRYEYDSREGMMDSTSWNYTSLTPTGVQAKIVPSFQSIDETRNIFSFTTADKFGDTTADLGFRYEIDDTNDNLYSEQAPGQAAQAFVTQQNSEQDDTWNIHGSTNTFFDKTVTFTSGFSVNSVDVSLPSGSRVYGTGPGAAYNPNFVNNGSAFLGVSGGGSMTEYTGNLNLMWTPIPNLTIVPAFRVEYEGGDLDDSYVTTSGVGAKSTYVNVGANSENYTLSLAQSLEARYTGFRDWSLYARAELSEDNGNQSWNTIPIQDTTNMDQNYGELSQKYTIGANWYPLAQLNFGGQYYHEIHDYTYTNFANFSPTPQYPGYLQDQTFTTDDFNLRATWQALSNVSLITRYDFQYSTVDTTSQPDPAIAQTSQFQSAIYTNNILSESATWTPFASLYLQVGGSYVMNSVITPMINSNYLISAGNNNYWTLDASAGYEFDAKTHLQVDYSYYNSCNYQNNTPYSLPYGADANENVVSATLTRQITKQLAVSLKYSFSDYSDAADGGQDNYTANLVYVSTQFKF